MSSVPTRDELLAMPASDYMNRQQQAFFRGLLLDQQRQLQGQLEDAKQAIAEDQREPDPLDQAVIEEENRQRMRLADRQVKLLRKVEQALARLDHGQYGYCLDSGEPIGLPRLLLRPTAELSIDAKQLREASERHYNDDRD